jgi:excinuclease ABC subunit C
LQNRLIITTNQTNSDVSLIVFRSRDLFIELSHFIMNSDEIGSSRLREIIKSLPFQPGVYLFRDKWGSVVYIGKAKNLKKRVSSYFSRKTFDSNKLRILVRQIQTIDHIVVETESDALLLENNLIKEYQPRYNVLLKDDKSYPYICVRNEPFPRVFLTRNPVNDGSSYFGPYTSVNTVRTLLELIRQLYPLRNCNYNLTRENINSGKFKVCLEFHLGNCKGPCAGLQAAEDYDENIRQIKTILRGNVYGVQSFLKKRMEEQARNFAFEEAQKTKERLEHLERYQSKSTIVNPSISNLDVFSFIDDPRYSVSNFIKVVNGAVIQSKTLEIRKILAEDKSELLSRVIAEIRTVEVDNSREIIVPFLPDVDIPGVKYTIPVKGDKKKLLELSTRNARYFFNEKEKQRMAKVFDKSPNRILEAAKQDLRLNEIPWHIECFDNSNIQGTHPVSACVVFRNGKPSRGDYRHYNIRSVKGPDDYASMKEVIFRRYKRLTEEKKPIPQLIIVDGGKAQLGAAMESLEILNLSGKVNVISIAKRLEEIFFPGDPIPLYLDKKSETLRLIQHLRNEAHRFSLMFHRQKRSSGFTKSVLESIPGLGIKTTEKLYAHFRTFDAIRDASHADLTAVIGKSRASILTSYLSESEGMSSNP